MARQVTRTTKTQATTAAARQDKTALYLRVSTDRQADEGNSLAAQLEKLQLHSAAHGWTVEDKHVYVDEGISGKSAENRPALQRMLQAAKTGDIQRIVATKFDRLARNTVDLLNIVDDLNKAGVALVLLDLNIDTGTPTGRLIATIMGSFAEWERNLITDRVMTGKETQAQAGEFNGAPAPIGYDYLNDGRFAHDGHEQTVRYIFNTWLTGQATTLRSLADNVNEAGYTTKTGSKWTHKNIGYVLRNGLYAGLAQWSGHEVPLSPDHPNIITVADYERAQELLSTVKRGRPWPAKATE